MIDFVSFCFYRRSQKASAKLPLTHSVMFDDLLWFVDICCYMVILLYYVGSWLQTDERSDEQDTQDEQFASERVRLAQLTNKQGGPAVHAQ